MAAACRSQPACAATLTLALIVSAVALPFPPLRLEPELRAVMLGGDELWPEEVSSADEIASFLGRPRGRRHGHAESGGGGSTETDSEPSKLRSLMSKSSSQASAAETQASAVEKARSRLLYNHLPKAGGSFVKKVLRESVGKDRFILEREFDALTFDNVTDTTFTIGSVRNPCEYYVSLWAFGSEGKGSFHAFVNRYDNNLHAATPGKDTEEDILRFRRWVSAIMPPSAGDPESSSTHVGLESARFAFSYSRDPYMKGDHIDARLSQPPREFHDDDVRHVEAALAGFDRSSIDCWVRAENLTGDTKECLDQYASRGGRVDWKAFQDAVGHEDHNPSSHAPCASYFDAPTEALVRRLEAPLFELFDYNSCCADGGP